MSLLIKDVQVIDGDGREPYKADVLVQKNVVSAIGNLKARGAARTIDGLGHYLAPGFVDVDTESDHYLSLFTNPAQSDFTGQGVTTIIGGHCGASLAPLLYGTLESISEWADPSEVNVNWHSVSELLKTLDDSRLGVNFGTLVGHTTVRRALAGESTRRLTKPELEVFKKILRDAMKEGAFGFSTGLGYVYGRSAPSREVEELTAVVGESGGVYTTHLRSETSELLKSVDETIRVSEKTGVRTIISHLEPFRGFEKEFGDALSKIEESKAPTYFDFYPYSASARAVYTLLPEWAQEKSFEDMLERIRNGKSRGLIRRDMGKLSPDDICVSGAPNHEYYVGKTVTEIARGTEEDPRDALLRLMEVTKLKATVFNRNIDGRSLVKAIRHPKSLVGSNGNAVLPGAFLKHERTTGTFPKFLDMALERSRLSLPMAIQKITAIPADLFGLKKRGRIKEGNIADLVLLDKNDYGVKRVVLGGKVAGEEKIRGAVLRRGK